MKPLVNGNRPSVLCQSGPSMSTVDSVYTTFNALLAGNGHGLSAAGLQGLLLGRSSGGAGFEASAWLKEATDALGGQPDEAIGKALLGLQEMARQELTDNDLAVVLLLPNDDAPLEERIAAVSQWSQGFLEGFGLAAGSRPLSAEAREALQDLAAIAQVQERTAESEEAEKDYAEVVEHVRLIPALLFGEFADTPTEGSGDAGEGAE